MNQPPSPSEAVARLKSAGMTEAVIAARVGCSQPTINRIRHGRRTPTYELGRRLVDLAVFGPAPEARDAA